MSKEEEIMSFLHMKIFDPILNSEKASPRLKNAVNLTITRMNRLNAEKMVGYFWSAISSEKIKFLSKQSKAEGFARFEDIAAEFSEKFDRILIEENAKQKRRLSRLSE